MIRARTETSAKLRRVAGRAIRDIGRPITAHELEKWLPEHDPGLWTEVSGKSYDYVRIILSMTSDAFIVQYKTSLVFRGVDERSAFYGVSEAEYNPKHWTPVTRTGRKQVSKKLTTRTARLRRDEPGALAPDTGLLFRTDVDDSQCCQAWASLTALLPPNDGFW